MAEHADGLDDLFDDTPAPDQAPVQAAVPTAPVADGLDDLFSDPPLGDGLDDLFGDEPTAPAAAPDGTPPAPAEASAPAADPAPAAARNTIDEPGTEIDPAVADLFAPPAEPIAPPEVADLFAPSPAAPATRPANPEDAAEDATSETAEEVQPSAPSRPSRKQRRRGASPEAAAAQIASDDRRRAVQVAAVAEIASHYAGTEDLWAPVGQILALFAANPSLSSFTANLELTRSPQDFAAQRARLEEIINPYLYESGINLPSRDKTAVILDLVLDELVGLSVLGPFWRDDEVSEIMVDAFDEVVVERNGVLVPTGVSFRDTDQAVAVARNLAQKFSDRQLSPKFPLVSAVLPGARATFTVAPITANGVSFNLRKFMPLLGMDRLVEMGALGEEVRDFLADCVAAGANIIVSGGTGTGKTTFVNALSEFIPTTERIVSIEDVFELRLAGPHGAQRRQWVAMQTKEAASGDDTVRFDTADLLKSSLRMRPDRIIVGEVREAPAAAVLLQAANTGHDGTMCTVHASDPSGALNFRFANWVRTGTPGASITSDVAVAEVAHAFDLVVQVERSHFRRFVSSVSLVDPSLIAGDLLGTETLFSGQLGEDNTVVFDRPASLRTDTDLARKLAATGALQRWCR